MIKEMDISEIDNVMRIWIEENTKAHDFIDREYWQSNYDFVKSAIADADVFVFEENEEIKAFIGIVEKSYIAGLFVSSKYQSKGIGEQLLTRCKEEYPTLKLDVYAKNLKAVNFYKKHGFKIDQEQEDTETNEVEYSMVWGL